MGNDKQNEKEITNQGMKAFDAPEMGAFEIVPGMTVEEMNAMFFDENALREPGYKVYQLNSKGHRYYYRFDDQGNPEFYPSVTTIISQTLPPSPFLMKWMGEKGFEEAERYKQERAYYGTFMHAQFERLLIDKYYDLDKLKAYLKDYIEVNRLPDDFIYYADDLKKDVLAFAQFIIDYDVKPLAIEIALVHPELGYAGMIDMPCNMQRKPGSEERVNAIVDFKSGRKGFFEEHEIQLGLYRDMWNVNFPDCPIERIANFSPKDWRKKPTYNFKDQTDSVNLAKIPHLLALAAIEDDKKDNIFTSVSGIVSIEKDMPEITDNIVSLTLSELIKTKGRKEETPDEGVNVEELKADAQEPTQQPEPTPGFPEPTPGKPETTPKKTRTVKRTATKTTKTSKTAAKKPVARTKPAEGAIIPKTKEKPAETKKAKNKAKTNLLNDEPEI